MWSSHIFSSVNVYTTPACTIPPYEKWSLGLLLEGIFISHMLYVCWFGWLCLSLLGWDENPNLATLQLLLDKGASLGATNYTSAEASFLCLLLLWDVRTYVYMQGISVIFESGEWRMNIFIHVWVFLYLLVGKYCSPGCCPGKVASNLCNCFWTEERAAIDKRSDVRSFICNTINASLLTCFTWSSLYTYTWYHVKECVRHLFFDYVYLHV